MEKQKKQQQMKNIIREMKKQKEIGHEEIIKENMKNKKTNRK